jgi:thioredoxin-like negative regulator of GroEL
VANSRWFLALAGVALAFSTGAALGGFHGRQPPSSLPQTLRGTVQVPLPESGDGAPRGERRPADTLKELYPTLAACWEAPPGLARLERTEITARFSLRRDGSLIGEPRITFATPPSETRARDILTEATIAAIRRCTPARITAALGAAIAGRPMALRFVYAGPRGQGI